MSRKLEPGADAASTLVTLRLGPTLARALAEETARRSQAAKAVGGTAVPSGVVVRLILEEHLLGAPDAPSPRPTRKVVAPPAGARTRRRAPEAPAATTSQAALVARVRAEGVTVRELAERAGVSRGTAHNFLAGRPVSAASLTLIAEAFGA